MRRLLLATLVTLAACGETVVPPPKLDTSTMEAAVAKLIDARYRGVANAPEAASAWNQYGIALLGHDLWDDAIACFESAHRIDPSNFDYPYLLGYARELRGADVEGTLAHLETAREIDPNYPPFYLLRGWVLSRAGRLDEARRDLETALTKVPSYVMAHANLGEILLLQGEAEQAKEHLEEALRSVPNDRSANAAMARALTLLGETDKAQGYAARVPELTLLMSDGDSILEEVRDVNRSADSSFERAKLLAAAGQWEKALAKLRITVEERPEDSAVHSRMGHALIMLGRLMEAQPHLERTLELKPEHVVARTRLGIVLSSTGRSDEAAKELDAVLTRAPEFGEALTLRASLYLDDGDLASAEELFRMAKNSPQGVTGDGYKRWGLALAQSSRVPEAVAAFEAFVAARPKLGEAHYLLAVAYEQTGQLDKAKVAYEAGLELDPKHGLAARARAFLPAR